MFKKFIPATIIIFVFLCLLMPGRVSAGIVPCGTSTTKPCTLCDVFKLLQTIINGISVALITWATICILMGGIALITSSGSPERVSQGKRMISYAIIGVIIALGAWVVINTVMNELVDSSKMPWPWNRIKCEATQGEGDYGYQDSSFKCYSAQCSDCVACTSSCIDGTDCTGDGTATPTDGKYCVCELPVYDLDLSTYPSQAKLFGKNAKVTTLASSAECNQKCNSSYSSYCPALLGGVDISKATFYCATEAKLKSTSATSRKAPFDALTSYCKIGCFSTEQDCNNSVVPGNTNFESCGRKCFFLGKNWCDKVKWAGGTGGVCDKDADVCTETGKPWALKRFRKEEICGGTNLFDCTSDAKCYCRLGTARFGESCSSCSSSTPPTAQWCQRTAPSGSDKWILNPPPGGADSRQKGDASSQLTSFLNCMYGKIPTLQINSISANALCDNPSCDTTDTTITCGPHAQNACHYGGKACTGLSYSVDFNTNVSCKDISTAAKKCDSNPWINWETNHTHITIGYGMANCDCIDKTYGSGKSCP